MQLPDSGIYKGHSLLMTDPVHSLEPQKLSLLHLPPSFQLCCDSVSSKTQVSQASILLHMLFALPETLYLQQTPSLVIVKT